MNWLGRSLLGSTVANYKPLLGGYLNHVGRAELADGRTVVIKTAPAYVASNPEIPLAAERVHFEADALALFAADGPLAELATDECRPPKLLARLDDEFTVVLEDLGDPGDLRAHALAGQDITAVCAAAGQFLAALHKKTLGQPELKKTLGQPELATSFDNRDIQATRANVQYAGVVATIGDLDLADAARSLGRTFMEPGRCLTMGDLWPSSLLVDGSRVRLIDWEFCHFGRPAQDVGHLCAHLSLLAFAGAPYALSGRSAFLTEYRALSGSVFDDEERLLATRHAGCELWARIQGPFRDDELLARGTGIEKRAKEAAHAWLSGAPLGLLD